MWGAQEKSEGAHQKILCRREAVPPTCKLLPTPLFWNVVLAYIDEYICIIIILNRRPLSAIVVRRLYLLSVSMMMMMMMTTTKCPGDNLRGPRQESGDVSGTSNTRDNVQVGETAAVKSSENLLQLFRNDADLQFGLLCPSP